MTKSLLTCAIIALALVNPASIRAGFASTKDESRLPGEFFPPAVGPDILAPIPEKNMPDLPKPSGPGTTTPAIPENPGSYKNLTPIEAVELTAGSARRALDAFAQIRDKYADQGIEKYDTLEEFAKKTEAGKKMAMEIKGHGFDSVKEWNNVITAVGYAFGAVVEDQEADIRQQIEDVKKDRTLSDRKRLRIIASLNAMIPSSNNKKVLQDLLNDPVYAEKLNLLLMEE